MTDEQLLTLAHRTGILTQLRILAAVHPEKIKPDEALAPAHSALLTFARAVMESAGH